ncbi:MAG: ferritin family protein [Anaerolineales bacterium]|nr:ferritin family protein [Anaerolineales bacterium]
MTVLTAAEALKWAMEIEKNGETFYNDVAAKSADPEVKALFEDLAVQERGHYRAFQKMLKEVKPDPDLSSVGIQYDEYQAYLQVALASALFAGPDKGLTLAEQAQDRETALRAAMGFEKDTLLFFYDLREMVSEAERGAISDIIREEKSHLRRLAKML